MIQQENKSEFLSKFKHKITKVGKQGLTPIFFRSQRQKNPFTNRVKSLSVRRNITQASKEEPTQIQSKQNSQRKMVLPNKTIFLQKLKIAKNMPFSVEKSSQGIKNERLEDKQNIPNLTMHKGHNVFVTLRRRTRRNKQNFSAASQLPHISKTACPTCFFTQNKLTQILNSFRA